MATARRPVEAMTCSAAASQASSLREAMTTSAPASASVWTMARPMPRDPPVTTATLPVMSCSAAKEVTGRSCHARGLRDGGLPA